MTRTEVEELLLPATGGRDRLAEPLRAVVVGGGLAGAAAAVVLAERGAEVELVEAEDFLGGRAGAWTDRLRDDTSFEMERGFHAFFRQYYNLRALLRRVDPQLTMLEALDDYPILGPDGLQESFAGLPRKAPWNVVALTRRTPTLRLRDLLKVNGRAALEMMRYEEGRTYPRFDGTSAREYLDSLSFPPDARRMLFDVFSHSFFNPESEMSAAEMLMMFHYYFTGNPEGLVFDVVRRPFSTAIWEPMEQYLRSRGVIVRKGRRARRLSRGDRWRVHLDDAAIDAELVVLSVTVPGLKSLVEASPELADPRWRERVHGLGVTRPFVVGRLWLDRPTQPGRAPFAGTTGVGLLDNISLFHELEDESRDWARTSGGSVVELHAYAVPEEVDQESVRLDLLRGLHRLYPETAEATILEERWLRRQDCPSFDVGSHASRPGVETPFPGLALAGDFTRLPFPSALMERAVSSGFLAANTLLAPYGVRPEPLQTVPRRGLFTRRARAAS